jgi:aspartate aminotransferase-like enzyme
MPTSPTGLPVHAIGHRHLRAARVPGAVPRRRRRGGAPPASGRRPAARAGAEALGLTLRARDPAIRSDTVTAVRVPAGIDEREVREQARAESGVMLSGGQGELAGTVLQIGHMGPAAYPLSPKIAVTAIGRALRALGAKADIGAAVSALET